MQKNTESEFNQKKVIQPQPKLESSAIASAELVEENTCKICFENAIECVFVDCGHMICCVNCSSSLKICPFCRNVIIKSLKFYK